MTRIALISDIHFGRNARCKEFSVPEEKSSNELESAPLLGDGAVKIIRDMGAEYLFISGDLTSIGNPAEFYYCEETIKSMAKQAGIDEEKIIWCSGNHDNDWSITGLSDKGGEYSTDIFRIIDSKYSKISSMAADLHMELKPKYNEKGPLPSSGVFEDDNMIVFVLNSSSECVRKSDKEHGKLTDKQLEWLENKLIEYKDDTRWKIILTHHHPFNYAFPIESLDISQLEDGGQFCDLAGKYGVDLILHGHRHHPRCKTRIESDWAKPITFICGGSFSVNYTNRLQGDIPNTFHVIELTDNIGELILYSFEYGAGEGWTKVINFRKVVPLDYKMFLGKVFDDDATINSLINVFSNNDNDTITVKWDELEDAVVYRSSDRIKDIVKNNKIKEGYSLKVYPNEYIIASRN